MAAQFAVETVDGSGLAHGQLSLAVDSNGTPHIAYATTHDDAGVAFARRDADGWALETLPAGSSDLDLRLRRSSEVREGHGVGAPTRARG